jgi:hypothetical protein
MNHAVSSAQGKGKELNDLLEKLFCFRNRFRARNFDQFPAVKIGTGPAGRAGTGNSTRWCLLKRSPMTRIEMLIIKMPGLYWYLLVGIEVVE